MTEDLMRAVATLALNVADVEELFGRVEERGTL